MLKYLSLSALVCALGLAGTAIAGPDCTSSGDKASACTKEAKTACTSDAGMVKGGGDDATKSCSAEAKAACEKACSEAGMVKGGGDDATKSCSAEAKAACEKACSEAGMVKGGGDDAAKAGCSAEAKAACAKSCSEAGMVKGGGDDAAKAACEKACSTACASHGMVKGGGADVTTGYGLGQKVPDFTLADTKGQKHNLSDFAGKVTVLVFYNQDCPYVVEMWDRLSAFTTEYKEKGVQVLAIDPGVNITDDARAKHAEDKPYPVLVNNTSELALNFDAKRTPEVFILDKEGVVQYHGAFDNGQAGANGDRKSFAKDAVEAILAGNAPEVRETKAFGCSIKFNRDTLATWNSNEKGKTKS